MDEGESKLNKTAVSSTGALVIIMIILGPFANAIGYPVNQRMDPSQNQSFSSGLQNSSWPMYCHDTRHTGLSPYNTTNTPGTYKWRISIGGDWIYGGTAIDSNGVIYFGGEKVYAAYPNGTIKWQYNCGGQIVTPAIASDGSIYVGSDNGWLNAFYPNGTLKWAYRCGQVLGDPVLADDGTIYLGTASAGSLVAITPNGTEKWRYTTSGDQISSPAIGFNGDIIFGSSNNVYSIYPNGTLHWSYHTGGFVVSSASIASDGTIYACSYDGYLYALNPTNGSLIWQCSCYGADTNPSIGPDGTIYCGSAGLFAINPNGTKKWQFNPGSQRGVQSSPAISADGLIYFGTTIGEWEGGELICINQSGIEQWRLMITDSHIFSAPSIAEDGTVYIGTSGLPGASYLYAFGRGPLNVDAKGPYKGYCQNPLKFGGSVWGGIPPYNYTWDFGDGNISHESNPTHYYSSNGNYTATLTVIDSEGNTSSDIAAVAITWAPPTVRLLKPLPGVYLFNHLIIPGIFACLVIGPITITASASEVPLGIERVEIYIDGRLKATLPNPPYAWKWSQIKFGLSLHTIRITAYDNLGHDATTEYKLVTKIF